MTVRELIAKLGELDHDLPVCVDVENRLGYYDTEDVADVEVISCNHKEDRHQKYVKIGW